MFRIFKKTRHEKIPDADALIAEMHERTGAADRAAELPAWGLMFRSPFKTYETPATSWLGGLPKAPNNFQWPLSKNNRPLHFIAQIDIAALQPNAADRARPRGLPTEGALLIFIGESFEIRILSPREFASSVTASPPANLESIGSLGFFGESSQFNCWAVDPVSFNCSGEERPAAFPDPFENPINWIDTHGLADIEISLLITAMKREIDQVESIRETRLEQAVAGEPDHKRHRIEERYEHFAHVEQNGPAVLEQLLDWQRYVRSMPPESAVEQDALDTLFKIRIAYQAPMKANYGTRVHLIGNSNVVWDQVRRAIPVIEQSFDFQRTPPALKGFVERQITDWRGHRLFGLEPEFPNNWEDRRGQDPFISVAADPLLSTLSEHDYGFSIWLKRKAIAAGQFQSGQLIRHCAV